MKTKALIVVGVFLAFGFLTCASVKVTVNYDEEVAFNDYKTFSFVPPPKQKPKPGGAAVRDPFVNKEILGEIKPVLKAKGLTEAQSKEEADLLVVFYAAVKNRRDFVPPTYRVGRWGRVWRTSPGHVVRWKEGTLVIDMVDRKAHSLVWQGVGKGVLDRDDPSKNLVEAVEKVLAEFPPEG